MSKHTVSTRASTSTAGCSCTKILCLRPSATAAAANAKVVISAKPCGIIDATDETTAIATFSQRPSRLTTSRPPAARTWPHSTIGIMMARPKVIHRTTRSSASRSSDWMRENCRASSEILLARDSEPTAESSTRPVPPSTLDAESTISPGRFGIGSFSPVSRDSSSSSESEVRTTASAGTWSPRLSTTTSPSTRDSIGTSIIAPSRTAVIGDRSSREIRSSSSLALYSCTKPIITFATTANRKSKSAQRWYRITTRPHSPSTRLNTVNRCARIMLHKVREDLLF